MSMIVVEPFSRLIFNKIATPQIEKELDKDYGVH